MSVLSALRQYRGTIAAAAVLGFLIAARHAGPFILLVWLVLIIYGLVATGKAIKTPELRAPLLAKASIWVFMSVAVVSWHFYVHHSTRGKAQQIVDKIESFHASNRTYPVEISDVGVSKDQMKELFRLSYYINKNEKVLFGYASTFVAFEFEEYNFANHTWVHIYD